MNQADQDLLALAAKAAGIKGKSSFYTGFEEECPNADPYGPEHPRRPWNPLTDNGDAFKLMVSLKLCVQPSKDWAEVTDGVLVVHENRISEPFAATRRAIVRAAAIREALSQPEQEHQITADQLKTVTDSLHNIYAYVIGNDDTYANGAIRQFCEEAMAALEIDAESAYDRDAARLGIKEQS